MIYMVVVMKNNIKKWFTKENILYLCILFLFIGLSTVISLKHEYWADEAQHWLIARDASVKEILFHISRAEGHPILYYLVIKLFQFFGLKYTNFSIISLLFSSLGVALLLFKSKIKWYIKILLPFTFFIFYQYTALSRSYCLFLPLLSLLAIIWDKRKEHYVPFTIILLLLLNLEVHTFLLSGSIYFLELIDFFKDFKVYKKNKKMVLCLILLFVSFLLTTIYMYPVDMTTNHRILSTFSSGFIAPIFNISKPIKSLLSVGIFFLFLCPYIFKKTKKETVLFLLVFLPVIFFNSFIYSAPWHEGIYFLFIIFFIWIHKLDEVKAIRIFILITCFIQIFWSISSSIHEYKYKYSSAEDVVEIIKHYDYENIDIYEHDFMGNEINAFFEKNIFKNWLHDKGYFSFYSKDYSEKIVETMEDVDNFIDYNGDIYIFPTFKDSFIEKLKKYDNNYNMYVFESSPYYKNDYNQMARKYTVVLIKKEIDKEKN